MAEHCCERMRLQVESPDPFEPRIAYDEAKRTYARVPGDEAGERVPIALCPWCGSRLRRVRARGLNRMSPELCRRARGAVSMTQRQVADAIGESLETVFGYELGKPTDPAVAEKLLFLFEEFQIAADRSGRICRYQT